jgi:hypothetical protein
LLCPQPPRCPPVRSCPPLPRWLPASWLPLPHWLLVRSPPQGLRLRQREPSSVPQPP